MRFRDPCLCASHLACSGVSACIVKKFVIVNGLTHVWFGSARVSWGCFCHVYLRRRRRRRRQQLPLIWPWHNKKLTASWSPFRTPSEWYSSLVHAFCQVVVYYFSDITTLVFSIYHQRTFTSPRTPNMTPLQRFMRYSFSSKYIIYLFTSFY